MSWRIKEPKEIFNCGAEIGEKNLVLLFARRKTTKTTQQVKSCLWLLLPAVSLHTRHVKKEVCASLWKVNRSLSLNYWGHYIWETSMSLLLFYFLINILILVTRENTVSLFTTLMSFISGNLRMIKEATKCLFNSRLLWFLWFVNLVGINVSLFGKPWNNIQIKWPNHYWPFLCKTQCNHMLWCLCSSRWNGRR